MPDTYGRRYSCAKLSFVSANDKTDGINSASNDATAHFGRQMKKERQAHGWTLRELADRMRVDFTTLSRIENGKRPPNEATADACDRVFPGRKGWFREYYEDSKSWVPAGFRDWQEVETTATAIRVWSPGVIDGFLQTEAYARALLETSPGATPEMTTARLASRMQRQRRVLYHDEPPEAWFVVDELSLYREVGGLEVMAEQMRHLASVARLPNVTMQVLPAVAHPAGASGCMVVEGAAYAEHLAGGYVFTDREAPETVTSVGRLFNTILAESYRASESLRYIEGMAERWTGGNPLTATPTAGSA